MKVLTHHFGIVVKDIQKALCTYLELGYSQDSIIYDDVIQHNRVVFIVSNEHNYRVELLQAQDEKSTIAHSKEGLHHICYSVENEKEFFDWFSKARIGKLFTKPVLAPALSNRKVIFGMLNTGTIVEFIL